jgi:amidase
VSSRREPGPPRAEVDDFGGARDVSLDAVVQDLVAAGDLLPDVPVLPTADTGIRKLLPEDFSPDPLNAIARWVRVGGDQSGALTGLRVTVKDSIALAGIPMTCGSSALPGFVPSGDASVVRRLVAEGVQIVAVTTMDDLAMSGGGETCVSGLMGNPHAPGLSAGGSSGGAAASLYYEGIDAAIGTDQGGSSRVPAAWCGVLGLKPTRGLIPYTGIVGLESALDHVGVLARDPGVLKGVFASLVHVDGMDARQSQPATSGLLQGRLSETSRPRAVVLSAVADRASPEVQEAFRADCERVAELGVDLAVSDFDPAAFGPVGPGLFVEEFAAVLAGVRSTLGQPHYEWREFTDALQRGVQLHQAELSPAVRATLQASQELRTKGAGRSQARARAQADALRGGLERLTSEYDFILTPTTPFLPMTPSSSPEEAVRRGWAVLEFTGTANISGQPSLSIPLSTVDGLPSGLLVTGAPNTDLALIDLAEQLMPPTVGK